jgi:hypothetical protein
MIAENEANQVRIRDSHQDRSVLNRYCHLGVRQHLSASFSILFEHGGLTGF